MRIVLVGKSCSGKTEISFLLREMGLKIATSSTSRPARIGEVDGVDYHFKKPEDFVRSIEEDSFIEYDVFNGWYYGVDREEFNKCDVLILTPRGLKHLFKNQDRREVLVIYIDADDVERLVRSRRRGDDSFEILRRYTADESDFCDFIHNQEWDLRIDQKTKGSLRFLIEVLNNKNY